MRSRAMLLGVFGLALLGGAAWGQTFNSGSTGADGPFNPPTSVPPGTTVNGSTYTVPLPASGVFNFTTITISSGITVKFTRNAANTPVVLLATGNVTLAGTLDVRGAAGGSWGRPGPGGPGGFDGGGGSDGGLTSPYGSPGLGPGGAGIGYLTGGGGGSYATTGGNGACNPFQFLCGSFTPAPAGPTYGSLALRPILGGSGGSGGYGPSGPGGGGGGGGGRSCSPAPAHSPSRGASSPMAGTAAAARAAGAGVVVGPSESSGRGSPGPGGPSPPGAAREASRRAVAGTAGFGWRPPISR